MVVSYLKSIKPSRLRLRTSKKYELNALLIYDERYIITKIRSYGDNFCTMFRGLNVP